MSQLLPALNTVFRFSARDAPAAVLNWIAAHPGQTALIVVSEGVILFTPAALTIPLLSTLGFGAQGPIAGTVAAWLQSMLGNVGAGSLFAYLQSAAMGGYGAAVVNAVVQAGAAVGVVGAAAVRPLAAWWFGGRSRAA